MKITLAAVFEPSGVDRKRLSEGLQKAGLKVSAAQAPETLGREQLIVLGPGLPQPARQARKIRQARPTALVLAALRRPSRVSYADGVLPLPVSAPDLRVRLPELVRLRASASGSAASYPRARPGDG